MGENNNSEAWYFDMVDNAAKGHENLIIANGMPTHARYLIQSLFRVACKSVQIFSGSLKDKDGDIDVYAHPDLMREVLSFIKKKGTFLDILVEKDIDKSSKFIQFLKEHDAFKHGVTIKKVYEIQLSNHIVVADKSAFRFETDHQEVKAIANFNDEKKARLFFDTFYQAFDGAKKISI